MKKLELSDSNKVSIEEKLGEMYPVDANLFYGGYDPVSWNNGPFQIAGFTIVVKWSLSDWVAMWYAVDDDSIKIQIPVIFKFS